MQLLRMLSVEYGSLLVNRDTAVLGYRAGVDGPGEHTKEPDEHQGGGVNVQQREVCVCVR